jgi:hypothetical protein
MLNSGRVVPKSELEEHLWNEDDELWSDVIRSHIKNLAKKIDGGHKKKLIRQSEVWDMRSVTGEELSFKKAKRRWTLFFTLVVVTLVSVLSLLIFVLALRFEGRAEIIGTEQNCRQNRV